MFIQIKKLYADVDYPYVLRTTKKTHEKTFQLWLVFFSCVSRMAMYPAKVRLRSLPYHDDHSFSCYR